MYMKKKLLNKNKIYYHQNLTQSIVLHQKDSNEIEVLFHLLKEIFLEIL